MVSYNMISNRLLSLTSLIGISLTVFIAHRPATAEVQMLTMRPAVQRLLDARSSSVRVGFIPPNGEGMPRHTRGGATRGSCDALQILPETGSGLTTAAKPMLQVYVRDNVEQIAVTIEADDGSEYYEYLEDTTVSVPTDESVIEVPLPESLVELTQDKQYTWSMILLCGESTGPEEIGPNAPVLKGGIRRVAPILTGDQDKMLTLEEKARIYSENGLWYDLVTTMTIMQVEQPESSRVEQQWHELLRSVGLGSILENGKEV